MKDELWGLNLFRELRAAGWSLRDFAAALREHGIFTSHQTVAKWTRGMVPEKPEAVLACATILGVTPAVLLRDALEPEPDPPLKAA